jgi:CpeT protein
MNRCLQTFFVGIIVLVGCTPVRQTALGKPSLNLLKNYMLGSYSSTAQAARDTNYLNIELEMARIWLNEPDGIWLYVEQASAKKKEKPYRQRVYHLQQQDDSTFISTVCNLDSMHLFIGAYKDVARLNGLHPVDAKPLAGCALILHWRNGRFVGSTHENDCKNTWGKATYATSEVNIGPDGLVSWDRGYDDTHTQVWGAENGGYDFVKRTAEPAGIADPIDR